jgi:hypothetical protein
MRRGISSAAGRWATTVSRAFASATNDEWEQEIDDVLDAAGSRVVVVLHQRGRLRGTQDWVELLHYGQVHTVEEGLIRRVQLYATPEEALEAAGLRE